MMGTHRGTQTHPGNRQEATTMLTLTPGSTAYVQPAGGRALLTLTGVTAQYAADRGCPGATVALTGAAGGGWEALGTFAVLGETTRAPGWSRGVRAYRVRFTPAVLDPATGTDVLDGYVNATAVRP